MVKGKTLAWIRHSLISLYVGCILNKIDQPHWPIIKNLAITIFRLWCVWSEQTVENNAQNSYIKLRRKMNMQ